MGRGFLEDHGHKEATDGIWRQRASRWEVSRRPSVDDPGWILVDPGRMNSGVADAWSCMIAPAAPNPHASAPDL